MIDWAHFTPWASLSGGVLIGVASALFILLHGRILGVSGILGGLLPPQAGDTTWRITFLMGLFAAPLVFSALAPAGYIQMPRIDASYIMLIAAGLMVGIGTRYGSGCTSGHGVCGLSRLSFRSLIATSTFMIAGVVTVYIIRHIL